MGMPNLNAGDVAGVVLLLLVTTFGTFSQSGYVCPKKFVSIGKKCYYFSKDEAVWHDAHFRCRNLNSSLAVITKYQQEVMIRKYLNKRDEGQYERWLGGRYNEKQSKWIWGENGKPLVFHAFSKMNSNDSKWAWHCIIVDPLRQNKWGAKSCIDHKRYICQKPVLGKKKRTRNKCYNTSNNSTSKELCSKHKMGSAAPAFLVKKPTQATKPYHVATFVCPQHMILVGRKCYFFSVDKASWSNAYWACRDNKTKLAVLATKMQDNILRGFLKGTFTAEKHERWIGGIYDWKQKKWKWAMSGRVIKYKNFAKAAAVDKTNNTHNCITLDPLYNNQWNSKNRLEEKYYICQAKSKTVVKYDKLTEPDATVVIHVEQSNKANKTNKKVEFSTAKAFHIYNNEVTESYIYN